MLKPAVLQAATKAVYSSRAAKITTSNQEYWYQKTTAHLAAGECRKEIRKEEGKWWSTKLSKEGNKQEREKQAQFASSRKANNELNTKREGERRKRSTINEAMKDK